MSFFLAVTDLGEASSQPYKPLNVKHEKSVRYLQPVSYLLYFELLFLPAFVSLDVACLKKYKSTKKVASAA
ncbi:hypothetical protein KKHLCK_15415 [Candidatus Electrothrix laxa]